ESVGAYLAFTDDDCLPEAGWLVEIEEALQQAPGAVCGGRTVNAAPGSLPTHATQLLLDYLYEQYNPAVTSGAFYPTNNLAVPRTKFLELGGFDERLRFGEDREFCFRWQAQGGSFVFAPRAVVKHSHTLSLGTFLRLHFSYGWGTGRFRSTCKLKGMSRPAYSSPLWYLGLLGYGLKREPGRRGAALSLLLAASQAASLAGVLYAWASGPPRGAGSHEIS
ncbi:MAG TPA: glycosyltransferase family 2 protein, partial [Bryobacteraceae bacterium]|nr:glycosyltransferase family 2 protein [Bryobacteraceae bacterium]